MESNHATFPILRIFETSILRPYRVYTKLDPTLATMYTSRNIKVGDLAIAAFASYLFPDNVLITHLDFVLLRYFADYRVNFPFAPYRDGHLISALLIRCPALRGHVYISGAFLNEWESSLMP